MGMRVGSAFKELGSYVVEINDVEVKAFAVAWWVREKREYSSSSTKMRERTGLNTQPEHVRRYAACTEALSLWQCV